MTIKQGFIFDTIVVAENKLALMYRDEQLEQVLMPGKHKFVNRGKSLTWKLFDTNGLFFTDPNADNLIAKNNELASHIQSWTEESRRRNQQKPVRPEH